MGRSPGRGEELPEAVCAELVVQPAATFPRRHRQHGPTAPQPLDALPGALEHADLVLSCVLTTVGSLRRVITTVGSLRRVLTTVGSLRRVLTTVSVTAASCTLGLHTAVKPLLSLSTTEKFNSPQLLCKVRKGPTRRFSPC
eukprot:668023-Prorocentrum_minimum.AAC.1